MLTPAFHFKILQTFAAVTRSETNIFLEHMYEHLRLKFRNLGIRDHVAGEYVEVQAAAAKISLDILMHTAFGSELSAQRGDQAAVEYLSTLHRLPYGYMAALRRRVATF